MGGHRWRVHAGVALAAALLAGALLLGACEEAPQEQPDALTGGFLQAGEPARVGDLEVLLEAYRFEGDGAEVVLVATLLLLNEGDDGYTLSLPAQLQAYDGGGGAYAPEEGDRPDGSLQATIPPGAQVRGEVRFHVPSDGAPYSVEFHQALGPERAAWEIDGDDVAVDLRPVEAPPTGLAVGATTRVGDVEVTVGTFRLDRSSALVEARGSALVYVSLVMANSGNDDYGLSLPLQVRLHDAMGFQRPQAVLESAEVTLPPVLAAGESVEGEIAFEVPSEAEPPFYFTFTQAFGDDVAVWVLA